jgi:hypothetical protein
MNAIEYVQSRAHRIRWTIRQLRSASFWRNKSRRLGARLGFYTAWLEDDFRNPYPGVNGIGWTWNPLPQWHRQQDLIALLKERAADAQNKNFLHSGDDNSYAAVLKRRRGTNHLYTGGPYYHAKD